MTTATDALTAGSLPDVTVPLVSALTSIWDAIRERHPDVPQVVVTLGSGTLNERHGVTRLGHFAAARWQIGEEQAAELFVGGEGLQRGAGEVLATLLHEAAHGVAMTRGIQDTSRQGRYHNAKFKALAQELGLTVTQDQRIGWSPSELAPGTADVYAAQLTELAAALVAFRHPEVRGTGKAPKSNNGVVAICECPEPRRIRVRSVAMFEAGPIICGVCVRPFAAEPDED